MKGSEWEGKEDVYSCSLGAGREAQPNSSGPAPGSGQLAAEGKVGSRDSWAGTIKGKNV
jgi:hypothetical protein